MNQLSWHLTRYSPPSMLHLRKDLSMSLEVQANALVELYVELPF